MQRLFALDVFRGLTILLMIMVNTPGTYGTFSHAYWDGITFADYVFPFFIVIVGVAIALGFKPELSDSAKRQLVLKIVKRSCMMFALGLLVNLIYLKFSDLRVLGVLQRIAIVYLVCSMLVLYCQTRTLWLTAASLLIGYWLLILFVPAPGLAAGQLERGVNLINWFDSAFLPGMLWRGSWDPEGILSTIPAIASGLAGVLIGQLIRSQQAAGAAALPLLVSQLFVGGFVACLLGWLWSLQFPLIKQIWSSSFVLVTSGMAAMCLATLIYYTDIAGGRRLTRWPLVFGSNAIVAYVLHVAIEKLLEVPLGEYSVLSLYRYWADAAGLNQFCTVGLWTLLFLCVCYVPVWWLYRRQIFIKI